MAEQNTNQNVAVALEAVHHVQSKLRFGAGNKWADAVRSYERYHKRAKQISRYPGILGDMAGLSTLTLPAVCMIANRLEGPKLTGNPLDNIRNVAGESEKLGCGNCGEQAAVAFVYLYDHGVRPIDYMWLTNLRHAFVVIGRSAGGSSDPATWGDLAVVCDPWKGEAYHLPPKAGGDILQLKMGCPTAVSKYRLD